MRNTVLFMLVAVFLMSSMAQGKALKAMLYCYLPAASATPLEEYAQLAKRINQKLEQANINVVVEVCDPNGNGTYLYSNSINQLFKAYDIVELDVSNLWDVDTEKYPFLTFTKQEINFYDSVMPFEWEPTTKIENGVTKLFGSPGLLCSDFIEERIVEGGIDRLFSKFKPTSSGITRLYLGYYFNDHPSQNLNTFDYNEVDDATLAKVANFLKECQDDNSKFNYNANWCINWKKSDDFFKTKYSTTVGYSENLYNFLLKEFTNQDLRIKHITGNMNKKIFFIDSFVAKNTDNVDDKGTILAFYKFMLSDEVLKVYIEGQYTAKPMTTYLLPPTKEYLNRLLDDKLYESIYETTFKNGDILPIHQKSYSEKAAAFGEKIGEKLEALSATINEEL